MAIEAKCHCGSFALEVDSLPECATVCNCTFCARTGARWGYYAPEDVRITRSDPDRVYDPRDINRHHFCGTCGGLMYNETPVWDPETYRPVAGKTQVSVNLNMIDRDNARDLPIKRVDGRHQW